MARKKHTEIVQEPVVYHTPIKDWPEDERPREKLLKHGPQALADAELLAILIRAGTGKQSALDIARTIMREVGTLRSIAGKSAPELMRSKGIGKAKAVELLAAFEIGRRIETSRPEAKTIIRSPEDVARIFIPVLRDQRTEKFHVIVLDANNGVKRTEVMTKGTLNASLVHPREVFKIAIDHGAAAIVVVHNHPSGNPEPSAEDIEITTQLGGSGKLLGIPLHDHIIIAGDSYTSFAERGLL